ncbi:MAG: NAD(P)-binding domain-containing protein, partial [Candidatus Dormiibacterota bacterium]
MTDRCQTPVQPERSGGYPARPAPEAFATISSAEMTTVAILGTGKMGGAMARRLANAGFDITLWNRSATRAEELHLGRVAASPAEAVRGADIVISSLTNDAAVRDVYLGDNGVLSAAAGGLVVDT